jgi:hypothetical protein
MLQTPNAATGTDELQMNAFNIYAQVYDEIYGQGRAFERRSCPFSDKLAKLLDTVDGVQGSPDHRMPQETLLLFLPVCVKHKQCISCFQEPDELLNSKGMRSLRLRVSEAASQIILMVHAATVLAGKFSPPFAACISVFSAGCCLITAAVKGWIPLRNQTRDIVKCTEVLTLYSMQWKGGRRYLEVWRALRDSIDFT